VLPGVDLWLLLPQPASNAVPMANAAAIPAARPRSCLISTPISVRPGRSPASSLGTRRANSRFTERHHTPHLNLTRRADRVTGMAMTAVLPAAMATRRLSLPVFGIAALTGVLAWKGWQALTATGAVRAIHAGQVTLAGPVVIGFVLMVFAVEQIRPAERRPITAPGHVLDFGYFIAHAVVVVPVVILIGTGFSDLLAHAAPWLVLPRIDAVPRWCWVVVALIAIDGVDWLAHLANHKMTALWRLHAVHHSQEELSILSTFRTHPLAHVSFVISAVPVLALAANDATPAAVLTGYACLGALPHANVGWSYGWLGRYLISPAYHRRHHSPTDRLDVNLGTILTVWDRLSGRAAFPEPADPPPPTGLGGRPIPVEQAGGEAILATLARQLAGPFINQGAIS
jgi:sterol desaturase/sphingolipid hydroxylase (fatty acid hydroxylase superfamily)